MVRKYSQRKQKRQSRKNSRRRNSRRKNSRRKNSRRINSRRRNSRRKNSRRRNSRRIRSRRRNSGRRNYRIQSQGGGGDPLEDAELVIKWKETALAACVASADAESDISQSWIKEAIDAAHAAAAARAALLRIRPDLLGEGKLDIWTATDLAASAGPDDGEAWAAHATSVSVVSTMPAKWLGNVIAAVHSYDNLRPADVTVISAAWVGEVIAAARAALRERTAEELLDDYEFLYTNGLIIQRLLHQPGKIDLITGRILAPAPNTKKRALDYAQNLSVEQKSQFLDWSLIKRTIVNMIRDLGVSDKAERYHLRWPGDGGDNLYHINTIILILMSIIRPKCEFCKENLPHISGTEYFCPHCRQVTYCTEEHAKRDWDTHKKICGELKWEFIPSI